MKVKEYLIERLTNCEAENEELRAANATLKDRLEHLDRYCHEKGTMILRPEPGTYYMVACNGNIYEYRYEYIVTKEARIYVLNFGNDPDIDEIDEKAYFLDKAAAEAEARRIKEAMKS